VQATRVSGDHRSRHEDGRVGIDLAVRAREGDLVRDACDDDALRQARRVETMRRIEEDRAADPTTPRVAAEG